MLQTMALQAWSAGSGDLVPQHTAPRTGLTSNRGDIVDANTCNHFCRCYQCLCVATWPLFLGSLITALWPAATPHQCALTNTAQAFAAKPVCSYRSAMFRFSCFVVLSCIYHLRLVKRACGVPRLHGGLPARGESVPSALTCSCLGRYAGGGRDSKDVRTFSHQALAERNAQT